MGVLPSSTDVDCGLERLIVGTEQHALHLRITNAGQDPISEQRVRTMRAKIIEVGDFTVGH